MLPVRSPTLGHFLCESRQVMFSLNPILGRQFHVQLTAILPLAWAGSGPMELLSQNIQVRSRISYYYIIHNKTTEMTSSVVIFISYSIFMLACIISDH